MRICFPFLSKILEKVVFKQVSDFLSQNNLLDPKQSGFKSGHSTETALLSVTEALRVAKASAQSSVLILLDLSAAFDTVNHDILLSTLSELGISGKAHSWFESYLSGHSFCVSWQGCIKTSSSLHWCTSGIGTWTPYFLFSPFPYVRSSIPMGSPCYAHDTQLYPLNTHLRLNIVVFPQLKVHFNKIP